MESRTDSPSHAAVTHDRTDPGSAEGSRDPRRSHSSRRGYTLLGVAVLGVALGACGVLLAQKKKPGWKSDLAGSVPTEFGELVSVTGDTQTTILTYKNSKNEVRVVRFRGIKLPGKAVLITRSENERKNSKWKQVDAGSIPKDFGELEYASGDPSSTFLAFKNKDNELRTVLMRGNKVPGSTTVIKREY